MLPTVAIVGRPNTGKSTLFNRLVGTKSSITFDESGTTRDRVFAHADIDERKVVLVDTGGLDNNEDEGDLESNIQKQTMIAIEEADVIVFLIDATEELTTNDFNAAQILRESEKQVILCASKCDTANVDNNFYNIYELGFGDPIKLSAIHQIGVSDLESRISKSLKELNFPEVKDFSLADHITISFVGRPNAGKSSLVNSLLGKEQVIVSDIPGTTLDSIALTFDFEDQGFVFVDTAGIRKSGKRRGQWLEKFSFMRSLKAIDNSDVCVLVIDASDGLSKQDMRISEFILESKKGLVIVFNKADLVTPEEKNRLMSIITSKMPYAHFAPLIFTSAKTGKNILEILEQAKMISQERAKNVKTRDLNYYIERVVGKHAPPAGLKFKFVEQVDINPPRFIFFVNKPEEVHFSYKRYLENKIREEYGFNGTALDISFKGGAKKDDKKKGAK